MHPVLFTLPLPGGPQPIYAYGLMLGLSLIAGFQIVVRLGARDGLDEDVLGTAYVVAALSGLVGARALYVLTHWHLLAETDQRWFDLTSGGLSAYGGLLGGFVGAGAYLRLKGAPLLPFADVAAPAAALGTALTRIGCYLHGCDFGVRLSDQAPGWLAALGRFPRWQLDHLALDGAPAFWHHVQHYDLPRQAATSYPVHPTQLYELIASALLFAGALWLRGRQRFAGQVFVATAGAYGLSRFVLEYLRENAAGLELFGFSTAQLLSLLIVPACALSYSLLRKR